MTNIVQASAPFQSVVQLNYTSAPSTVTNADEVRSYFTTTEKPLTIADPVITLDIVETSISTTDGNDVTIGEQITFHANLVIPQGEFFMFYHFFLILVLKNMFA